MSVFRQSTTCYNGEPKTHNCGSRIQQLGEPDNNELLDGWRIESNGDHCCTYCGSLSEEEYLDITERYGAGEEGYRWSSTDKGYKRYASRPGVTNASEGGIKFYGWHATPAATQRGQAAQDAAWKRQQAEFAKRTGG